MKLSLLATALAGVVSMAMGDTMSLFYSSADCSGDADDSYTLPYCGTYSRAGSVQYSCDNGRFKQDFFIGGE
jgi:hypothetical protein